jgi:hypothetical protein
MEKDNRIWKEKLDWVVHKGGMALLNTHPDYMYWNRGNRKVDEYPQEYYASFLEHVKTEYQDEYWNVLPVDLARYWKKMSARGQGFDSPHEAGQA